MTRTLLRLCFVLIWLGASFALSACAAQLPPERELEDPFGRGISFGNALEAPNEGEWGITIQESYVQAIADAGFNTVRLPVKWSAHAEAAAPYTIDPSFLARVDEVVGWILERGLNVIVDFPHYDEMSVTPAAHTARWLGIWAQLAEHYQDAPAALAFELLNEPNQALDAVLWNSLLAQGLAAVRQTNPTRLVVIGPASWNAIGALDELVLPQDDHLVLTFHFYDPFDFTHQGAEWVDPPPPLGRQWTGQQLTPAGGWADWSWDSARDYGAALTITFQAGWAGYYLEAGEPASGYTELAIRTSHNLALSVLCGPFESGGTALQTTAGIESVVPLATCGGAGGVERVVLQDATGLPQGPFVLATLELRGPQGTLKLIASEEAAIGTAFDLVDDWVRDNGNLPVLVGEFGAYHLAAMDSRVRWTEAVRRAAEERGFGWAYWEFGSGFGAFDPVAGAWRPELLAALLGD